MSVASELLETSDDEKAFDALTTAMRSRSALALVGAGFGQRVGYPSWEGLLRDLRAKAEKEQKDVGKGPARRAIPPAVEAHPDVLWRAEELRRVIDKDSYRAFLETRFAPTGKQDECVDLLVRLPFRHILTTNYDASIEEAHKRLGEEIDVVTWGDEDRVHQMMYDLLDVRCRRRLVHLHGSVRDVTSIVLTDSDYSCRYLRNDSAVRKLFALFAMQRFVFFGFSLTDPDLSMIMRQVAGALGYGQRARHFAFVGVRSGNGAHDIEAREVDRRRFRKKFGVEPIFYDDADGHAHLLHLMRELASACDDGAEISAFEAPAAGVSGAGAAGGASFDTVGSAGAASAPSSRPGKTAERARVSVATTLDARVRNNRMNPRMPLDPRKDMFGGSSVDEERGRRMTAVVSPVRGSTSLFDVVVTVASEPGATPLEGSVTFYLHDTFTPSTYRTTARNGSAQIELTSYGAFTIGLVADDGTELELDLETIEDAPKRFKDN